MLCCFHASNYVLVEFGFSSFSFFFIWFSQPLCYICCFVFLLFRIYFIHYLVCVCVRLWFDVSFSLQATLSCTCLVPYTLLCTINSIYVRSWCFCSRQIFLYKIVIFDQNQRWAHILFIFYSAFVTLMIAFFLLLFRCWKSHCYRVFFFWFFFGIIVLMLRLNIYINFFFIIIIISI